MNNTVEYEISLRPYDQKFNVWRRRSEGDTWIIAHVADTLQDADDWAEQAKTRKRYKR